MSAGNITVEVAPDFVEGTLDGFDNGRRGRFDSVEHVAAPRWSPRRWIQRALSRPWQWVFEGCDMFRDTAAAIEQTGFSEIVTAPRRMRHSLLIPVDTAISGIATN